MDITFNIDISYKDWFKPQKCPVCGNISLTLGETVDVGFGDGPYGRKCGPDTCDICFYVEQGPDPSDKPIEYYKECWKKGIIPNSDLPILKRGTLSQEYKNWITENVNGDGYGKCRSICYNMVKAYPILQRVYGTYYDFTWGERTHFWCIDKENYIIDPTAMQFPSKGTGSYIINRFYPLEYDEV